MRSSTSRLPERSIVSGMSTPCTPAMSMVIDMRPGTITVRNSSATRCRRGRMLPNTSTTSTGWVSVAMSSMAPRCARPRAGRAAGGRGRRSFAQLLPGEVDVDVLQAGRRSGSRVEVAAALAHRAQHAVEQAVARIHEQAQALQPVLVAGAPPPSRRAARPGRPLEPRPQRRRALRTHRSRIWPPGSAALERGRRVEGEDPAVVDDGQPLAEPVGLFHVVRGEDDGEPALVQAAQGLPEQRGAPAGRGRWWARRAAARCGSCMSARAIITRCCRPPERVSGFASALSAICISASRRSARASRSAAGRPK